MSVLRCFLLTLCISSLCACTSTTQTENNADAARMLSTAKTNIQLGMMYLDKQDIQKAKRKFLTALEEAPTLPDTWYSMGYYLETTGESTEARTYYEKAISLADQRGDVHNNFGTYLCRQGEYQAAIKQFQLAVRDLHYIDTAGAYENAGLCALKIPDQTLAITFFQKSVQENPEHPSSYLELAELYYQQHEYSAAKKNLQQFLRLSSPTSASMRLSQKLGMGQEDETRL